MFSAAIKALPVNFHEVQFYEEEKFLLEKLKDYISEGLATGESVIVVGTQAHRDALIPHFSGDRALNRYIELDAAETLAQFMVNEWPDPEKFHAVMGQLLRQAADAGNGQVRIFGEMVALLWEKGRRVAALHLENLWNELAAHQTFSLLCAYPIQGFSSHDHTHYFQEICKVHSTVTPAEKTIAQGPRVNGESTALAMLQQQSLALEGEAVRRQELQRILHQREEELADFLENAVESVHQVGPDGTILWANKAEMTMLGYQKHEYIGRNIAEFYVDQSVIQEILQRLLHGETLHDHPAQLRCKDGSVKDVLIHSNGRWENGNFRYTRCFTRDITERKRVEQELDRRVEERTRELVESQQRLRALAAELSLAERRVRKEIATELHDYLAQLLIVTRLKLVQATQEADEHHKIRQVLKEADDVLNESILYTRTLMTELNPPILEFGLPMGLRWLAGKFRTHKLAVETHIPDDLELQLSEDQMGLLFQSVRELLMNVVKHADTDRADIVLRCDGDVLSLDVVDQGKGFDPAGISRPQVPEQVMVKFGLFSIRERMKMLGGEFEISSFPAQGTRASLVLPLEVGRKDCVRGESDSPALARESLHSKAGGELRVLLVEDHAVVREGLRGVLQNYPDIEVVAEAGNGEDAIAQAEKFQPDVVIMDINLPKIDGIEATRRIVSRSPKIIVIGLSVHQATQVEPALLQAGGAAYVTKESAASSLYDAIQTAAEKIHLSEPATADHS